jgi:hypothetical protein
MVWCILHSEARSFSEESLFQGTKRTHTASRELDGTSHRGQVIVAEKDKTQGIKKCESQSWNCQTPFSDSDVKVF